MNCPEVTMCGWQDIKIQLLLFWIVNQTFTCDLNLFRCLYILPWYNWHGWLGVTFQVLHVLSQGDPCDWHGLKIKEANYIAFEMQM